MRSHSLESNNPAFFLMRPGVGRDGYFDAKMLMDQVKRMLPLIDKTYGEDVTIVFFFDQSAGHASYAPDALQLLASRVHLNDGGKGAIMSDGYYKVTKVVGTGWRRKTVEEMVIQPMWVDGGRRGEKIRKGALTILRERGRLGPDQKVSPRRSRC